MRCAECKAPAIGVDEWDPYVCTEDPTHEGVEDSPWFITNDALAEWALTKLALAEQNLDRINEHADDMVRRAEEFRVQASRTFQHDADFFRQHLAAYYEKVAPTLGKTKTYALVNGELSSRQGSEVVEVDDPDFFVQSALAAGYDELVRTTQVPDKTAIKKALKAGEVIVGVRLVRKPDEVKVRPSKAEVPAYNPMPRDEAAA